MKQRPTTRPLGQRLPDRAIVNPPSLTSLVRSARLLGPAQRSRSAVGPAGLGLSMVLDKPLATVRLHGRLTGDTVRALGAQLAELIRGGHRYLVLDLNALSEAAPVCVGVLNRTVGELRQVDGTLALRGVDSATVALLNRAGLHPSISLAG